MQIATSLSQQFANHGLQFFKVNKTITHVSVARPHYLDMEATPVSEGVRKIVEFINSHSKSNRRKLIDARQYVLNGDWGQVQPNAEVENKFLERHSWDEYASWHLGLTDGAKNETKARYAFVYGDLRRVHRSGLIACVYRAAEWRHKQIELAAHDLLQHLDRVTGVT